MSNDGTGILVNDSGMAEIMNHLQTAVSAIDKRMNQLEDDLKPLRNDWSGVAQQQYHVSKGKWDQAILEMKQLLATTAQQVETSHAEYKGADKRGEAAFQI